MATTADMRSGLIIKVDGSLYTVIDFGQNKTARAAAKVWAKLKGVDNTRTIEQTWNSPAKRSSRTCGKERHTNTSIKMIPATAFMDQETFEQITVPETMIDAPKLF